MHTLRGLRTETYDADATPLVGVTLVTQRPPEEAASPADPVAPRCNTPLLPTPLPIALDARATLTVLTGLQAGQVVTIDGASMTIGRAADADILVDELGVSRHHARIARAPAGGFYVEDLGSTNGTFVGAARVGVESLRPGDVLQLGPSVRIRFAIVDLVEEALQRQLYESSVRDPLTHVFNRRYFLDRLTAEIARGRRADRDVTVLMVDVDSLKTVNDSFGHLAGDRAICTVAARMLRALRAEDVMARYGGDEFVVLACATDLVDARPLAERLRRAVEGLHLSANEHEVRITASIGVASLAEVEASDEPVAALLALADARMYDAKASGKNKVCSTGSEPRTSTVLAG